eukprot:gene18050-24469_t
MMRIFDKLADGQPGKRRLAYEQILKWFSASQTPAEQHLIEQRLVEMGAAQQSGPPHQPLAKPPPTQQTRPQTPPLQPRFQQGQREETEKKQLDGEEEPIHPHPGLELLNLRQVLQLEDNQQRQLYDHYLEHMAQEKEPLVQLQADRKKEEKVAGKAAALRGRWKIQNSRERHEYTKQLNQRMDEIKELVLEVLQTQFGQLPVSIIYASKIQQQLEIASYLKSLSESTYTEQDQGQRQREIVVLLEGLMQKEQLPALQEHRLSMLKVLISKPAADRTVKGAKAKQFKLFLQQENPLIKEDQQRQELKKKKEEAEEKLEKEMQEHKTLKRLEKQTQHQREVMERQEQQNQRELVVQSEQKEKEQKERALLELQKQRELVVQSEQGEKEKKEREHLERQVQQKQRELQEQREQEEQQQQQVVGLLVMQKQKEQEKLTTQKVMELLDMQEQLRQRGQEDHTAQKVMELLNMQEQQNMQKEREVRKVQEQREQEKQQKDRVLLDQHEQQKDREVREVQEQREQEKQQKERVLLDQHEQQKGREVREVKEEREQEKQQKERELLDQQQDQQKDREVQEMLEQWDQDKQQKDRDLQKQQKERSFFELQDHAQSPQFRRDLNRQWKQQDQEHQGRLQQMQELNRQYEVMKQHLQECLPQEEQQDPRGVKRKQEAHEEHGNLANTGAPSSPTTQAIQPHAFELPANTVAWGAIARPGAATLPKAGNRSNASSCSARTVEADDGCCVVCHERDREIRLKPCGHAIFCRTSYKEEVWDSASKARDKTDDKTYELPYLHPLGVWDSASKARDKTDDKTDELSTPAGKSGTQPQRHETRQITRQMSYRIYTRWEYGSQPQRHETRQMTRQMSYLHPLGVWDSASRARDKTDDKTDELSTPAGSLGLSLKGTRQDR